MTKCNVTTNKKNLIRDYVNVYIKYLQYINYNTNLANNKRYLDIAPILEDLRETIESRIVEEKFSYSKENISSVLKRILKECLDEENLKELAITMNEERENEFNCLSSSLLIRQFIANLSIEVNDKRIKSAIEALSNLTLSSSFTYPEQLESEYFESLGVKYQEGADIQLYIYQALTLLQYLDELLINHLDDKISMKYYISVLLRQLETDGAIIQVDLLVGVLDQIEEHVNLIKKNKTYLLIDTNKK